MYNIYYKDNVIAENVPETDIDRVIGNYIRKLRSEIDPIIEKIGEIEALIEEVYPRRKKDTDDEYLAFLQKVNPEFIEALEELGKSFYGNRFTGIKIIALNTVGILLEFMTGSNYIDKIPIGALRMNLRSRIPTSTTIEIKAII